ncbi:MAG TPA: alpha/beta fold hydrolase [Candidatus Obscuribacterales bacterium]
MRNKAAGLALLLAFGMLSPVSQPALSVTPIHAHPSINIPMTVWADKTVEPRAVLLCIHGLGLHKGNYANFGKRMASEGIITYAMDARGFGEWQKYKEYSKIDPDGTLKDAGAILEAIHAKYPKLPVIVLGESMGGALALQTVAKYQDKVNGLICSVPSADRFRQGDNELHVALNAFFRGFDAPINVGKVVVKRSTKKQEVRDEWQNDPLSRSIFTVRELMKFQSFMKKNIEMAHMIDKVPVLFVQGGQDNLVIPAGTLALKNALNTPNKQFVLSGSSEHLIFEVGQFNEKVLGFVLSWINNNVTPLPDSKLASAGPSTVASIKDDQSTAETGIALKKDDSVTPPVADGSAPQTTGTAQKPAAQDTIAMAVPGASQPAPAKTASISYWIELLRDGKKYRCNSRMQFRSGDKIRFHVIPESDGYAYVVLKQGTSGKSAVLFPEEGNNNLLHAGMDYPLPYESWLAFDRNPGIEKLSLVFSRNRVDTNAFNRVEVAYIGESGAKDIVPTRMKLSWDPEAPAIISADTAETTRIAHKERLRSNLTKLVCLDPGVLAVDIALAHH